MVSTRQQSNISGGGDNSGSGSGSESSGSTGSTKSLRHHTSSHQASASSSNGNNYSNCSASSSSCSNSNSGTSHETSNALNLARSFVSTRQSIIATVACVDSTINGLEPSLIVSKSLRHFSSSVSNTHDGASGSSCTATRTTASTRQQQNSTINTSENSLSCYTSEMYSTTKSLRYHSANQGNSSTACTNSNNPSVYGTIGQGPSTVQNVQVPNARFLDLPHEILEKIFTYIGYRNVSQMRLVCRQLDRVCGSILNSTFQRLQTQMLHRFQAIKSKMPRRESARRNHPLACESDIIETLHMRLTLLQMSFGKHIERKHCCFFAGEILDEVYRILLYIKITPKLARPYKVTDELFDLSTMAMEYFKEHIEPTLPEIAYFGTDFLEFTGSIPSSSSSKYLCLDLPPHSQGSKNGDESPGHTLGHSSVDMPPGVCSMPQSNIILRKRIRKIKQGMRRYNYQLNLMRREIRQCKGKFTEQQKQIHEYASRLDENDKKNEETSRKFSTLLQELNKCKTELQYWRSKSPLTPMCIGCGKLTAPVPSEDVSQTQVLPSQPGFGVIQTEAAISEEPCLDAGFPVTLPGTSTDEEWNAWSNAEQQENNKTPTLATVPEPTEEKPRASVGGKRKASCDMKNVKSNKKQRTTVFKFRSKRH